MCIDLPKKEADSCWWVVRNEEGCKGKVVEPGDWIFLEEIWRFNTKIRDLSWQNYFSIITIM